MQKITPFLWFDHQAEEAANLYTSLFPNSRIVSISHWGEAGPGPVGQVMIVTFQLDGQEFMALNGGPEFKFTEAISLVVNCETQQEVDRLWDALSAGGEVQECGWLKDRFGLSWQIVPVALDVMMRDQDPERVRRVTQAMLQMQKLDIKTLQDAYEQG